VSEEAATTSTELEPALVAKLIAEGAELIDVRRPYEYEGGRLAGSRNVEMNELTAAAESIPRDRPVLFYCRGGNRSGMAAQAFREAGYEAHNLIGGIEAWVAEGRPLEPEDGEVRAPLPAS
jgi:rhodanese-related sulfurtransferase